MRPIRSGLGDSAGSPRISRRLQSLSHRKTGENQIIYEILPGGAGTGGEAGPGPSGRTRLAVVGLIVSVSSKLGSTPETLRQWARRAERNRGVHAGLTSAVAPPEAVTHAEVVRDVLPAVVEGLENAHPGIRDRGGRFRSHGRDGGVELPCQPPSCLCRIERWR